MALLNKQALLAKLLDAFAASGWNASVVDRDKPFLLQVTDESGQSAPVRIFIWNCTHGGGQARADDEYRIQFTGNMPREYLGSLTLLLGWHDGYGVFAAWDIRRHDSQTSKSPSAQIKERALQGAHTQAFATMERENGEIVVSFRPEFVGEYCRSAADLHAGGAAKRDFGLLNEIPDLTDEQVNAVANAERRSVIQQIVRKYRAYDFSRRVLSAYDHKCAACGIQLALIEAAHIDPVSNPGSTDETKNGIALCALHHSALDSRLISFDEGYRIQVSGSRVRQLRNQNRVCGLGAFKKGLRDVISLPADRRDYPDPVMIVRGRQARDWKD